IMWSVRRTVLRVAAEVACCGSALPSDEALGIRSRRRWATENPTRTTRKRTAQTTEMARIRLTHPLSSVHNERVNGAGVVALLFTDLVGSTELLDRLGDDAAEVLRRTHFRLLRDATTAYGGEEVKSLGDGLMVVFPATQDAV